MSFYTQLCVLLLLLAIVLAGVETVSNDAKSTRSRSVAAAKRIAKRRAAMPRPKKKTTLTDRRSSHAKLVGKKMDFGTNGKWTVIHFWATWCRACTHATPELVNLHKKFSPLGIDFVGINLDSDREAMSEYLERSKMIWPQIVTMDGWQSPIRIEYDIPSVPAIYLVSPKGIVVEAGIRDFADGNNRILHHLSR